MARPIYGRLMDCRNIFSVSPMTRAAPDLISELQKLKILVSS